MTTPTSPTPEQGMPPDNKVDLDAIIDAVAPNGDTANFSRKDIKSLMLAAIHQAVDSMHDQHLMPEDFDKWAHEYSDKIHSDNPISFRVHISCEVYSAIMAAYRKLSQTKHSPSLRWVKENLDERIKTLEQKYASKGFETDYSDIMTRGGIFYLKQVRQLLDEDPSESPSTHL